MTHEQYVERVRQAVVARVAPDVHERIAGAKLTYGVGSGSRLRLWVCACPAPVKVRVASDEFRASCKRCNTDFVRGGVSA